MFTPATARSGFTLVEALVALMLFGLIASAGAAVLSVSVDNRFVVRAATDRTAALQRTRSLLKADLGQATNRRTRDRNGEPHPLALAGERLRATLFWSLAAPAGAMPGTRAGRPCNGLSTASSGIGWNAGCRPFWMDRARDRPKCC